MLPVEILFYQLTTYSIGNWMVFLTIAVLFAYFGGILGIIAGHIITAVFVCISDVLWVQSVMAAPGWDGTPDQDFVFLFGTVF
ncbi:MAG: hypothetical protein ACKVHE_26110 [Planctomycetales bacterium]|jgi:hypothetical protein